MPLFLDVLERRELFTNLFKVSNLLEPRDRARLRTGRPAGKPRVVSDKLPVALRAYRLFSSAMTPLVPFFLARRVKRGKELRARLPERRGDARIARPDGSLVWLHAASVGELASVLPLIELGFKSGARASALSYALMAVAKSPFRIRMKPRSR